MRKLDQPDYGYSYVEKGSLYVNEAPSVHNRATFRKQTVNRVQMSGTASSALFDDPKSFPKLETVSFIDRPDLDLILSRLVI
jgi:hypothetical protein